MEKNIPSTIWSLQRPKVGLFAVLKLTLMLKFGSFQFWRKECNQLHSRGFNKIFYPSNIRQEQKVGHFRDFLVHFCFFLQFMYDKFNHQLIGILWSSGLRHQDSNEVILQVCGSIPSPVQYFFIKLFFHELLFSFLKFIKIFLCF